MVGFVSLYLVFNLQTIFIRTFEFNYTHVYKEMSLLNIICVK